MPKAVLLPDCSSCWPWRRPGRLRRCDQIYDHGDYAAALRELRPLAQQGNLVARRSSGAMYLDGKG